MRRASEWSDRELELLRTQPIPEEAAEWADEGLAASDPAPEATARGRPVRLDGTAAGGGGTAR